MMTALKESLWKQFGASIDMLKNAIVLWPEEKWNTHKRFFYITYHTLVFLDYYLTMPAPKNFKAQLSFTDAPAGAPIDKEAVDDIEPDRLYTKKEILDYLQFTREKCHRVIASLTEEKLTERWIADEGRRDYAFLELLLYNMRHVQHHAAQLNMMLRQEINDAPRWVARARDEK
jgi:hypothetical protein